MNKKELNFYASTKKKKFIIFTTGSTLYCQFYRKQCRKGQ